MKKTILLMAACCVAAGVDAQYLAPGGKHQVGTPTNRVQAKPATAQATANKTTLAADSTRWYWHRIDMQDASQAGSITQRLVHLWYDSTVTVNYSDGPAPVNFASAAQVIDPVSLLENEPTIFGGGTMGVRATDQYRVDSVWFRGAYVKNPNRPASVVDTLIISVAPQTGAWLFPEGTDNPWVAPHLPAGEDTLWAASPNGVDNSDLTTFLRVSSHPAARIWRIPVGDADREEDSSGFVTINNYRFAVPGGPLNIPAGQNIAITVAFHSGDIVAQPNVDSIDMYHHFMLASWGSTTATMNYTWFTLRDRSMSSLMFTTSTDPWWSPAIAIEGWQTNPVAYTYEYHDIAARVTCNTCLSLDEISALAVPEIFLGTPVAFPNPANSVLNVPFTLKSSADVKVSLTNTVGQVVAAQNMGKVNSGKAEFSTSNLAPGVYFYTVDANGQRLTGRAVIAH